MTGGLKHTILSLLMTMFIASLIIFDLSSNVLYSNFFNLLLWVAFLIVFILEKDYRIPFPNIILTYFLFSMFAIASVLWAVKFNLAYSTGMRLIVVTLNLIVLYIMFERYRLEKTVLYGILLGAFYNFLIAFNIIHVSYEIFEFGRFLGTTGNSNKLANVMIISIFSSLVFLSFSTTKGWFKIYNYLSIMLSFYLVVLTVSKKAMILAPLMILLSFSVKSLRLKNIILFFIVAYVGYKVAEQYVDMDYLATVYELVEKRFMGMLDTFHGQSGDQSSEERAHLISGGLDAFANHPFIGIGLNNFRVFFGKYAHNNYIELLVGIGIIGMILFYTIYAFLIQKVYQMDASNLRRYFGGMIIVLLVMDMATVTYYNKLILFVLLFMYFMAENHMERLEH